MYRLKLTTVMILMLVTIIIWVLVSMTINKKLWIYLNMAFVLVAIYGIFIEYLCLPFKEPKEMLYINPFSDSK